MIQALKTVLPIQEKIRAKEKRYLCLNVSEEEGRKILEGLEKTRFKARTRLLRELLDKKRLEYTLAAKEAWSHFCCCGKNERGRESCV